MEAATKTLVVDLLTLLEKDPNLRLAVRDSANRLMSGSAKTNLRALMGQGPWANVNGPAIGDNFAAVLADVSDDTPE